jgi:hypothetical protein
MAKTSSVHARARRAKSIGLSEEGHRNGSAHEATRIGGSTPNHAQRTGRSSEERAGRDETVDLTVDPRVAATGGRRRIFGDEKKNYEWPGMASQTDWLRTRVHQHTIYYGCSRCGTKFKTPHAAYSHLAKIHRK